MVTLYNVVSADGFIARKDGSEDFIPDDTWNDFLEMLREYDAVVIGRKTYEAIQGYPDSMIEAFEHTRIPRVVVSRETDFHPKSGYRVFSSISEIPTAGKNILLTSGPTLNTAVLQAGLVDRIILNVLTEKIGEGLSFFQQQPDLHLQSTKESSSGRRFCTYSIDSKK